MIVKIERPGPRFSHAAVMARNINQIVKTISFRGFATMAALYHGAMLDGKRQLLGQRKSQGKI